MRETRNVGDDENAKIGMLGKGAADGGELGDDRFGVSFEQAGDAFEVEGLNESATGSSNGGGGRVYGH